MAKPGQIIIVKNIDRKFGSDPNYVLIYTSSGMPLLFTEEEINSAVERAHKNPEDFQPFKLKLTIWQKLRKALKLA